MLDIWDPRNQDRNNIISDATKPLSLLHEINCEKIYVAGNHDDDIDDIAENVKEFSWKDPHKFFLCRHYPEGDKIKTGQLVNEVRYSFIHGHQFDKEQISYVLSKILDTKFDPVDFFQDLSNVSFTKRISKKISLFLVGLFVFYLFIYFLDIKIAKNILGVIFASLACFISVYYLLKAKKIIKERNESGMYYLPFLLILIISLSGIYYEMIYEHNFFGFWLISYHILEFLVSVSLFPKLVTHIMREAYLFGKPKVKTIEHIGKNYNLNKDTMNVNVVVLGHTHKPGSCLEKKILSPGHKLFVNTGCWVNEDKNSKVKRDLKTFAYIDNTGIFLLKWINATNIQCISNDAHRDILRPPLKYQQYRSCKNF